MNFYFIICGRSTAGTEIMYLLNHHLFFYVSGPGGSQELNNPFRDKNLEAKLAMNPKTREFMKDPDFLHKIQQLKNDPSKLK